MVKENYKQLVSAPLHRSALSRSPNLCLCLFRLSSTPSSNLSTSPFTPLAAQAWRILFAPLRFASRSPTSAIYRRVVEGISIREKLVGNQNLFAGGIAS